MRKPLVSALSCAFLGFLATSCRSAAPGHEVAETAAAAAVEHDEGPAGGRYVGYAKPEQLEARLPTVFELVRLTEEAGKVHYRLILRLAAGSLGGAEYASAYFADVVYDRRQHAFTWGGAPSGLALSKMQSTEGGFAGTLSSEADKTSAAFAVHLAVAPVATPQPFFSQLPVLPSPIGSYSGSCPGHISGLQLEASHWREAGEGPLFAGVQLSGRLVQADPVACVDDQPCLKRAYNSGSYQPLSGQLDLRAGVDTLSCKLKGEQLVCGDCTLTYDPISPYSALAASGPDAAPRPRTEHLPAAALAASDKPQAHLPAPYYGYLHHEASDSYQLVALNMQVERPLQADAAAAVPAALQLSGVASLYFGEGDSSELIAYRFNQAAWSGNGPFVLDGDGEAFVVVDRWDDSGLTGTWYAKTYGRVGTIELQPRQVPALAAGLHGMPKLSHAYKGGDWDFDLAATANLSERSGDFYPLKINGWAKEKHDQARRRTIKEGSYDFYTGRVALRLDDGRVALGRLVPGGLQVYWPAKPRLGSPLAAGAGLFKPEPGSL